MRLAVGCFLLVLAGCANNASVGYRMEEYNAVVNEPLPGAITVLDTEGANALWSADAAVFIDVLPQAPKPDLPPGTLWRERSHDTIPGALWLPDVGYGAVPDHIDRYFRTTLSRAVDGDPDAPVVFFCRRHCWMSWNAAKRAYEEYGYRAVHWYPEGTDGWQEAGYSMTRAVRVSVGGAVVRSDTGSVAALWGENP